MRERPRQEQVVTGPAAIASALTRLSLVGLLPSIAQLRFAK